MSTAAGVRAMSSIRTCCLVSMVLAITALAPAAGAMPPPHRIPLPNGFSPEGISIGHGDDLYVGSIPTGAIYRADVRTGAGKIFIDGHKGRSAVGLKVRYGKLFVAGGETGDAYVYDARSGKHISTLRLTRRPTFVNDVVVTRRAAWFTDSFNPVLYRVPLRKGAPGDQADVRTIPLKGIRYQAGFNLNGIDATPTGGKLIVVQSNTGLLFRVAPRTGRAHAIRLNARVRGGDGVLLDGRTLFVVQNSNRVAVVRLGRGLSSGEVVRRIRDLHFDVPTTVALRDGFLYVVNARFSVPPTPRTKYWVTVIPRRAPKWELAWKARPTGSHAQLRGLDAETGRVAWASGSEGTVLRTVNGGRFWKNVSPPGTRDLEFRDVEALDRDHASILAIGPGSDSRIYRTVDGGATWRRTFVNHDERAFYDCMDFFGRGRGLALSDPVAGKFRVLATANGGRSWRALPPKGMPPALSGEFAFAASGTCLVTGPGGDAWFATGGGGKARVFHSRNAGRTWSVAATPVRSTESGGIFSLAFLNRAYGLAVGGDFLTPNKAVDALALTSDGGGTWKLVDAGRAPAGYRSGSAWLPRLLRTAIVVGPTGSDVSTDGGHSWSLFDRGSFDSVECAPTGGCWASGENGRAARLTVFRR